MGTSIIVSSGKGGVGKTNTVINLGVALTKIGKKVIVIDGSLTTPDIFLYLGIPFHVQGLSHILKGDATIESASFTHKSGLKIIPGNIHIDVLKEIKGKKFSRLLKELKREHDFVLVDGSAGLGTETLSAVKHCDKMLVVANPELASVVNASKTIQISKNLNVEPLGVVLNRLGRFKPELGEEKILPLFYGIPIIGRIPEDIRLPISANYSGSVLEYYPYSRTSREFLNLAYCLSGLENKREESFFTKIKGFFQRNPKID